jgi:hypothetical protein
MPGALTRCTAEALIMMSLNRSLLAVFSLLLVSFALPAGAQAPAPASSGASEQLKPGEIEALVAPIALFPDSLVSLVLMASTYPLEVVQADRWVKSSKLKDDELKAAVDKQPWDESVRSLVATPSVLTMMSEKLDWMQKLGDAVLAQQEDVMDAVQRLRARAQAKDNLKTTKEQTVTVSQVGDRQVIAIEQTDPNTVYVPYYEPATVYGDWPYDEYPPYYFPTPGWYGAGLIGTGLAFGAGYALARWATGGNWWGGGCNWGNRNIISNRPVNINNIGNNWRHNVDHRHGVRYNNANVAQKFGGGNNLRSGAGDRMDFRGKDGARGGRDGIGDRTGAGDRAGLGDRQGAGDRAGAGNRDRAGAGNTKADRGKQGGRDAKAGAGNRAGQGKAGAGNRAGQAKAAKGGGNRAAARPGGGNRAAAARPGGGGAFNMSSGRAANAAAMRGHASLGGGRSFASGGGPRGGMSMGGGGFRGGGGGGFRGGGGGGRRSDIELKHDITLLGHLDNGLGFYRFSYVGETTAYVGVMAQEVQRTMPHLVTRDQQGYLRVFYDRLGVKFQTYEQWLGTRTPALPAAP